MNEFKVGDRVRCVDAEGSPLVDGAVYVVYGVGLHCVEVRPVGDYQGTDRMWDGARFVPATEGINVGDTVRVVEGHWCLPAGKDLLVSAVDPSHLGSSADGGRRERLTFNPTKVDVIQRAGAAEDDKSEPAPEPDETLESFKLRVWEAAQAAKRQHGWCSEVDKVVADLGIEAPTRRYRVAVQFEVDVSGVELKSAGQFNGAGAVVAALRGMTVDGASSTDVRPLLGGHWDIQDITQ